MGSDRQVGEERVIPEMALAVACIVGEAGNQPQIGMVAVAEVIRNRGQRRYASDGTVAGTIFRAKQFSCFNDSTPWRPRLFALRVNETVVVRAKDAWETAMGGSTVAQGAVLYHTIRAPIGISVWPPRWATAMGVTKVAEIGDHVFYDDEAGKTPK